MTRRVAREDTPADAGGRRRARCMLCAACCALRTPHHHSSDAATSCLLRAAAWRQQRRRYTQRSSAAASTELPATLSSRRWRAWCAGACSSERRRHATSRRRRQLAQLAAPPPCSARLRPCQTALQEQGAGAAQRSVRSRDGAALAASRCTWQRRMLAPPTASARSASRLPPRCFGAAGGGTLCCVQRTHASMQCVNTALRSRSAERLRRAVAAARLHLGAATHAAGVHAHARQRRVSGVWAACERVLAGKGTPKSVGQRRVTACAARAAFVALARARAGAHARRTRGTRLHDGASCRRGRLTRARPLPFPVSFFSDRSAAAKVFRDAALGAPRRAWSRRSGAPARAAV
jgi:hypothetical protein